MKSLKKNWIKYDLNKIEDVDRVSKIIGKYNKLIFSELCNELKWEKIILIIKKIFMRQRNFWFIFFVNRVFAKILKKKYGKYN